MPLLSAPALAVLGKVSPGRFGKSNLASQVLLTVCTPLGTPISLCSTQHNLVAGEPCIGARHVQQCMWTGRNRPDAGVPVHAPHYQMLLTSKVQQWQDDNRFDPYLSTSQVLDDCAHLAIEYAVKAGTGT